MCCLILWYVVWEFIYIIYGEGVDKRVVVLTVNL